MNLSKTLAYMLRHKPAEFNLTLLPGGWVSLSAVVNALNTAGSPVSEAEVLAVVEADAKTRFSVRSGLIRANQGHSTTVNLQLTPEVPPTVLYHGTASRFIPSITVEGLKSLSRHAVHMSATVEVAEEVGRRHGKPVVLTVAAGQMHAAGHVFTRSANGVWLVESVPAQFLTFP